ncbi:hypothetical protein [Streptomyces sp. CBMA152]|uniref:hypothetical protein n=1 Tax=Streptomyces sp. CBMA152 TaxID=1896312 RepID=UPI0016611828|nr:hypothetical protein [Streptomyces sp. CBMA152]MBD0746786.1 hypothetical protein [Streptomyces sp. CBMA152]
MADEPDTTTLKDQYAARVAADLDANQQDQARIREELDTLQTQLQDLERDHGLLQTMRNTLTDTTLAPATATPRKRGPVKTAAQAAPKSPAKTAKTSAKAPTAPTPAPAPDTTPASASAAAPAPAQATVPKPRAQKADTKARKTAKTVATKAAKSVKKTAAPAKDSARSGVESGGPTLRELVLGLFADHKEPRTVADIVGELATAHPDRTTSSQVVRNTLEALVAKGELERERKQGSVFYTAPQHDAVTEKAQAPAPDAKADTTATAAPVEA